MPNINFPRIPYVMQVLENATAPSVPSSYLFRSTSGKVSTRATISAGRRWVETYAQISIKRPETHEFLSYINQSYRLGHVFQVTHPTTPGSGEPHLGSAGTHSITVSGGGQSGDSIVTSGWPSSTMGLLLPGTLVKFAGIDRTFMVTEPVNSNGSGVASVSIDPPIFTGLALANGAAMQYNDVTIRAVIADEPVQPGVENTFYYSGLSISFLEVP